MTDIQDVKKILEEPLSCTDGQSHYLDEGQKRYLMSQIDELYSKCDEGKDRIFTEQGLLEVLDGYEPLEALRVTRDLTASIKDRVIEEKEAQINQLKQSVAELKTQLSQMDMECQKRVERIFKEIENTIGWSASYRDEMIISKVDWQSIKQREEIE